MEALEARNRAPREGVGTRGFSPLGCLERTETGAFTTAIRASRTGREEAEEEEACVVLSTIDDRWCGMAVNVLA